MKLINEAPFRTDSGLVITMKAVVNMNGVQHVECYENNGKHDPATLTPMTDKEYQEYMNDDLQ